MKTKFISIAATLLLAASFTNAYADEVDYYLASDKYGWDVNQTYKFNKDANGVYTLTVNDFNGKFKIRTNDAWFGANVDAGAEYYGINYNVRSAVLHKNGGENLYIADNSSYTFKFTIINNDDLNLSVSANGFYLVGDFTNWGENPKQMELNTTDGSYSIEQNITSSSNKFKFIDGWGKWYGGDTQNQGNVYGIHNNHHSNIPLTEGNSGSDFIIERTGTYTFKVTSDNKLTVEGFPPLVSISEDEAEQDIINTLNYYKSYGEEVDFVMTGRTIYMHQWNTICLPFSLTNAQLQLTFLKEYTIKKMSGSSLGADGTLYLNFESQNAITAGVPYLIYCGKSGASDLYKPRFDNVVIDRSSADYFPHFPDKSVYASFIGTFVPYRLEAGPDKYYYLGENSTLYYPSEAVTVGPFRAYFQVTFPESSGAGIKSYCLNFDDETTSIQEISNTSNTSNAIFTLDGRRINGQPATAGLYIINGKKVVIK